MSKEGFSLPNDVLYVLAVTIFMGSFFFCLFIYLFFFIFVCFITVRNLAAIYVRNSYNREWFIIYLSRQVLRRTEERIISMMICILYTYIGTVPMSYEYYYVDKYIRLCGSSAIVYIHIMKLNGNGLSLEYNNNSKIACG